MRSLARYPAFSAGVVEGLILAKERAMLSIVTGIFSGAVVDLILVVRLLQLYLHQVTSPPYPDTFKLELGGFRLVDPTSF
jgi:hypothetical protein